MDIIKKKCNNVLNTKLNNENLLNDFKSFEKKIYNYKYTRQIVKNHVRNNEIDKQKIYNYFFGGTVKLCSELLKRKNIEDRLLKVLKKEEMQKKNFTKKENEDRYTRIKSLAKKAYNKKEELYKVIIMLNSEYNKSDLYILKYIVNYYKNISNEINYLLYIFFYIIPSSRRLIKYINDDSTINNFGKLIILNTIDSIAKITILHNFNMERFVNYNRLNIILNKINKNNIELNINEYLKDLSSLSTERDYNPLLNDNLFPIDFDINLIKLKQHIIILDIPIEIFDTIKLRQIYRCLRNKTNIKIQYFTYDNKVKRFVYGFKRESDNDLLKYHHDASAGFCNNMGKKEVFYDNINNILIILSYCLSKLRSSIDIILKKKFIIIFYYLIIYWTPFIAGTSSIAEMYLYTLWNTYIKKPLTINQNIMLDIEALSSSFTTFYDNCFNKNKNDIYTPFLIIEKKQKRRYIRDTKDPIYKILRNIKRLNENSILPLLDFYIKSIDKDIIMPQLSLSKSRKLLYSIIKLIELKKRLNKNENVLQKFNKHRRIIRKNLNNLNIYTSFDNISDKMIEQIIDSDIESRYLLKYI